MEGKKCIPNYDIYVVTIAFRMKHQIKSLYVGYRILIVPIYFLSDISYPGYSHVVGKIQKGCQAKWILTCLSMHKEELI